MTTNVYKVVGYDPQKLLAPPDKRRTFHERMRVWETYGDLAAHGLPDEEPVSLMTQRTRTWPFHEHPDDYPLFDVSRWDEADSDPLADLQHWIDLINGVQPIPPDDHKVVVVGTGRIAFDHVKPARQHGKTVYHVDLEGDYSELEAAVLRAMLLDGEVTLNLKGNGSLPGIASLSRHIMVKPQIEPLRKEPDYLKHDRTKNHKRRTRRGKR